jgi:hypothetical protein
MELEVTLDIFSGRPNPTWSLEHLTAQECKRLIDSLPPLPPEDAPVPPGLGYRGFIIQSRNSTLAGPIMVYGGAVKAPTGTYRDHLRKFEAWLLKSAGSFLESSLIQIVGKEIKKKVTLS